MVNYDNLIIMLDFSFTVDFTLINKTSEFTSVMNRENHTVNSRAKDLNFPYSLLLLCEKFAFQLKA